MNEYLPRIVVALAGLIAIGWHCYRWGHADGKAEGYLSGDAVGRADSRAAEP